jgi:KAP family P-loop domain
MSRDDGDGPASPYKIWSSSYSKVSPAKSRAQLTGEAVDRARMRAVQLVGASESHQDPSVRTDVLYQFDKIADSSVVRFADVLIGQLVANEEARRSLKLKVAEQRYRIDGAVLFGVLAFALGAIADIGSGPGGLDSIKTGWRFDLLITAGLAIFVAVGLGIWAAVMAYVNNRSDQLSIQQEMLEQNDSRLQQNIDAVLEAELVQPIITQILGDRLKPTFSSQLQVVNVSMFAGPPKRPIETSAFHLLEELAAGFDGASIGLCGPRGVGKSTLIRHFCRATGDGDNGQTIGICVDVPVAYAQRDFLANIYSRLLDEVVEQIAVGGQIRRNTSPRKRFLKWSMTFLLILVVVASATVETKGWRFSRLHIGIPELDRPRVTVIAAVLVAAVLVLSFPALIRRRHPQAATAKSGSLDRIRESVARGRLNLTAEVATSSSVSGSVALVGALNLARSGTRQVSRGLLSYPDLVGEFRRFVECIANARVQTRIGIDELDKLDSDDARSFLNGLKAIFGLPRTYFLVSVSEDAMSDFERRGVPIRDAFDSSLDEVVRIPALTVEQSMRILSSRGNYDFPLSFGALCHCLSGGLPRELLRVARRLVRHNARIRNDPQYGKMKPLCAHLIADDLEAKSDALWVVARSINVEPYTMRFRSWLANSDENRGSPEGLLSTCQAYLEFPVVESREFARVPEWLPALERLGSLALEFTGYRYFAATLLSFFSRAADAELRHALSTNAGTGSLQTLSFARARFADDPRLAWEQITIFREAHHIEPVLPVPAEGWRLPSGKAPSADKRGLA